MTIEDFLARRSRMLFLDAAASMEAAPVVAKMMADIMLQHPDWIKQQLEDYVLIANNYLPTLNTHQT